MLIFMVVKTHVKTKVYEAKSVLPLFWEASSPKLDTIIYVYLGRFSVGFRVVFKF